MVRDWGGQPDVLSPIPDDCTTISDTAQWALQHHDVVIAGVRAMRELKQRHAELRQDIQVALAELNRGEGEPWDANAIKAEFDQQLDANSEIG